MAEKKTQSEKFKALARESDCDEDEERFDENLRGIASAPPPKVEKQSKKKRKPAK